MLVRDVMSSPVVTCDTGASLADAVAAMTTNRVGSVIVLSDGSPTGIVTETDVLRAAHEQGASFDEIDIELAKSDRMHTIAPDATIMTAVDELIEYDVKKLPVVDGLELVGIITYTDVIHHFPELRDEARKLAREHYNWEH